MKYTRSWLAYAIIVVAALLPLYKPILFGEVYLPLDLIPHQPPWSYSYERTLIATPHPSDLIMEYYPRRLIASQIIRQGEIPLWNPTILAGMPLLADGYSATLYPLSIIFVVLPVGLAFGWYAFIHLIIAGIGTYHLARLWRFHVMVRLFMCIGYMWSGFSLSWLVFPEFSAIIAWQPWLWLLIEQYEQGFATGKRTIISLGIILGFCILCHVQLALYVNIGIALFWLAKALIYRKTLIKRAGIFLASGFLALGLSAAQWVPTLQAATASQRSNSVAVVGTNVNLLNFILPTMFGKARTTTDWGSPWSAMLTMYVGSIVLLLCIVALWNVRSRILLVLLAVTSILIGLVYLPKSWLSVIPLLNQLPAVDRWFIVISFVLIAIAAHGLQSLLIDNETIPKKPIIPHRITSIGFLSLIGLIIAYIRPLTSTSRYGEYSTLLNQWWLPFPRTIAFISVCFLILIFILKRWLYTENIMVRIKNLKLLNWTVATFTISLLMLDLGWYGLPMQSSANLKTLYRPTRDLETAIGTIPIDSEHLYPPTRFSTRLSEDHSLWRMFAPDYPSFPTNTFAAYGFQDVRGYASLFSRKYLFFVRAWEQKDLSRVGLFQIYLTGAYKNRKMLDLMNVRYIMFNPKSTVEPLYSGLELIERHDEGALYRNPTALPRAFIVHQTEVMTNEIALLNRLMEPTFPISQTVLLEEPVAVTPTRSVLSETVQITNYTPNHIDLVVHLEQSGVVVVSDSYDAGWHATIDRTPAKLLPANYILRAIATPAGTHQIRLFYRPTSVVIGMTISGLSLSGLILMGLVRSVQRYRRGNNG